QGNFGNCDCGDRVAATESEWLLQESVVVRCSSRWALLVGFVAFVSLLTTAYAQEPNSPAPTSTADADDTESLKPGSTSSFTLPRKQSLIQAVEMSRDAIGRKDF